MKVTVEQLKKGNWGTPCGHVGEAEISLSKPLVISFIETFFSGVLDNVIYCYEDKHYLVEGGQPILTKLTVTTDEFNKFTIDEKIRKEFIKDCCIYFVGLSKFDFEDVENKIDVDLHPKIICLLFSHLVEKYGGSFRVDYLEKGEIDLESE